MAMMDFSSWIFVLVMSAICGLACSIISMRKGYTGTQVLGWLVMGCFFSVFALIAIILAPHKDDHEHG
jgi:hypothetical protein